MCNSLRPDFSFEVSVWWWSSVYTEESEATHVLIPS